MKIALCCGNIWRLANSLKGARGMIQWKKVSPLWVAGALAILAVLVSSAFVARVAAADEEKPLVAPEEARQVKNPIPLNPETLAAGTQVLHEHCAPCHGRTA